MNQIENEDTAFFERIRETINLIGNQNKAAAQMGITVSSVARWYKGESDPSRTNLVKLARAAGVNVQWLATGEGAQYPNQTSESAQRSEDIIMQAAFQNSLHKTDELLALLQANKRREQASTNGIKGLCDTHGNPVDIDDFVFIPYYNVELSAGRGSWVESEEPTHSLAFRVDWLRRFVRAPLDKLSVVKVKGDSMVNVFNDKDTILIDHTQVEPHDGLYAIRLGNDVFVKRLQRLVNKVVIISANPEYPPFEINLDDENFAVIGRVVWLGRLL